MRSELYDEFVIQFSAQHPYSDAADTCGSSRRNPWERNCRPPRLPPAPWTDQKTFTRRWCAPRRERGSSIVYSLRLDPGEITALERRAAALGLKPTVLARNLVRPGLEEGCGHGDRSGWRGGGESPDPPSVGLEEW